MIARLCVIALMALPAAAPAQPAGNPASACFSGLANDPRFAPIRDKLSLGGSLEEMRRMTKSGARASDEEKPALAGWKAARDACHQLELPYYASRDIGIQAAAGEHFAALQALIDQLQAGTLTYGEFGRRRIELYETLMSRVEKIRKEILPPKPVPLTPSK